MEKMKWKIPPKTMKLFRVVNSVAMRRAERAYAVGGFVRDLLMKRPTVDVDLAVLGRGVAFAHDLAEAMGGRVEAFTQFGTAIVIIPGFGKVDVAMARSETYERPGALPDVKPGDIGKDLARRDFTINSMALSLDSRNFLELIDPYRGVDDLKRGLVRAHHAESFTDDPTRIFRAVRFEQRFGKRIEEQTGLWMAQAIKNGCFDTVSGERIRNELILLFKEPRPERAVLRLEEIGVLRELHPKLGLRDGDREILKQVPAALRLFGKLDKSLEERWMIWFQALVGRLSASEVLGLSERLMLSRAERKIAHQRATLGRRVRARLSGCKYALSCIHSLMAPLVPEVQCFLTASLRAGARRKVEQYLKREASLKPWVRGGDLQKLGVPPGFQYSYILQKVLSRQMDGELQSKHEALKWVKTELLHQG